MHTVKPVLFDISSEHWNEVTQDRGLLKTGVIYMKSSEEKLQLGAHNTSHCLIEVVTKYRVNQYQIHYEGRLKLRAHNTSVCLI
jgi:hypothetical protein